MFYIIGYQPFSEKIINFSNAYSEFCIGIIYFMLPIQNSLISQEAKSGLEYFMVYTVYSVLFIHILSPLLLFFQNLRQLIVNFFDKKKVAPSNITCVAVETVNNVTIQAWREETTEKNIMIE